MIGLEDVGDPHDASVLMSGFCADVEDGHSELVIKISESEFCPYIFFGYVWFGLPSMGLTSNSWHISLNLSLNLGSDLI